MISLPNLELFVLVPYQSLKRWHGWYTPQIFMEREENDVRGINQGLTDGHIRSHICWEGGRCNFADKGSNLLRKEL